MKMLASELAAFLILSFGATFVVFAIYSSALGDVSCTSQPDCGPASLYIVSKSAQVSTSFSLLKRYAKQTGNGTNLLDLKEAAQKVGWEATGRQLTFANLIAQVDGENNFAIAYLAGSRHFVAVLKTSDGYVWVVDPRSGSHLWSSTDLQRHGWQGHVLLLSR